MNEVLLAAGLDFCILRRLYLEVDLLAKSGIEVDFKFRHLFLDGANLFLQARCVFFDSGGRSFQHFLRLLERHVEEGIANFIPAIVIVSDCALLFRRVGKYIIPDFLVLVGQLKLGR